jgi:predicted histone-like DNA-binding protein
MSVKFKEVERVNPRDLTLPKKKYAILKSGDDVNFEELAEEISKVSSLNYGEVMGALGTLIVFIEIQLRHGRPVRLSTLGTFYLSLNSEGVDTDEELTSDAIKKANIRFRPGKRLKKLTRNLDYVKVHDVNGNGQAA